MYETSEGRIDLTNVLRGANGEVFPSDDYHQKVQMPKPYCEAGCPYMVCRENCAFKNMKYLGNNKW